MTPPRAVNENVFTFPLDAAQRARLRTILAQGNYLPRTVPYAEAAAEAPSWKCNVVLYSSGKLVVQGKGARDFVENVLETEVLGRVVLPPPGAEGAGAAGDAAAPVLGEEALSPHAGVDESGKGDFLGPLVVAAAYVDAALAPRLVEAGARDSKAVTSDKRALEIAARIREILGPARHRVVRIGPAAYNRLYAKLRSVNRILDWAHARAIEGLLAGVPDCPMAISDQFGDGEGVRRVLRRDGFGIELRSRPRAEADVAVAAASLLAREAFLGGMADLRARFGGDFPKGAAPHVRTAAEALVRAHGPAVMLETAKCHFRTLDQVLAATGHSRAELPPEGQVLSVPSSAFRR